MRRYSGDMTDGAIDYGRYGKLLGFSLLCFLGAIVLGLGGMHAGIGALDEMYRADPEIAHYGEGAGLAAAIVTVYGVILGVAAALAYGVVAIGLNMRRRWGVSLGTAGALVGFLLMIFAGGFLNTALFTVLGDLYGSDYTPASTFGVLLLTGLTVAVLLGHCVVSVLWLREETRRPQRR
ncbi:hypothetical protein GCM10011359_02600 [Nesterenkonia alkaliphila]|nr:hypothetical protein GCM10011359_02600 [Nesterenkonia alkaliphila]